MKWSVSHSPASICSLLIFFKKPHRKPDSLAMVMDRDIAISLNEGEQRPALIYWIFLVEVGKGRKQESSY